jgi:tetratricopeptide (TPR) repeat protein
MFKITNNEDFYDYFFKAEKKRAAGQLVEAVYIYQELLSHRLKQVENPASGFDNYDAIIIERLADLSQLFGTGEASINLLTGLLQLYQEVNNTYLYIYTIIKIASIHLGMEKLEETFSLLEQLSPFIGNPHQIEINQKGLSLWENNCQLDGIDREERIVLFSRLYYIMGVVLANLGQYSEAVNCVERGLYWVNETDDEIVKTMFIPLSLEKINALVERGDVLKAEEELRLIGFEKNNRITSGNYTAWLELNAKIQFLKGNYGESLGFLSQVIELCRKHQLTRAYVTAILNLARIKIYLNQLAEAGEFLEEAANISKTWENDSLKGRISQLNHLVFKRGNTFLSSFNLSPSAPGGNLNNQPGEDDDMYLGILDTPQSANFLNFFEDRALEFQVLLADGKYKKALLFLDNVKQVFIGTDSLLIRHRIGILEFLIHYYQNNLHKLQVDFQEILSFLEKESLKPELWQFQRILSWTGLLPQEEKEELIKRNEQLLAEMTQTLPPESQAVFMLNKWTADEEYLAAAISELVDLKLKKNRFKLFKIFTLIKMMKRLNKLLYHIDMYKDVLARKTINHREEKRKAGKAISLLYRVLRHPRDRVTISYLVLPDRLLIVYTTFLKFNFKLSVVNRIQVRELIKKLHQGFVSSIGTRHVVSIPKTDNVQEMLKIPGEIAEVMQIPEILAQLPKPVKKITFIPDDSLNGFPFAVLPYQGDYLIKKYSITIGYESNIKRKIERKSNRSDILLAAISEGKGEFPDLPGAKTEIEEIKKLFFEKTENIKVLCNENANKTAILSGLARAKFFHIACHGKFEHNRPDATGLILRNGEVLSLRDILNHDSFDGIVHITLSSCWAADHFILPGRWVISLPETLWRSGVKGMMGCLWQVSDNIAAAFMKEFYKNMKDYPRDIALQKTQLAALANKLPACMKRTENPFYWSGFNLYGDYKKVIT